MGFCFVMLPILKRKKLDSSGRRDFLKRHLDFFNTNPILASYVLGATASAELACDPGGEPPGPSVPDLKRGLAAPLAMLGDTLFWGALRPLAGLTGVLVAMEGRLWAPLGLLVVYNVPGIYTRIRGLTAASVRGPSSVREFSRPWFGWAVSGARGVSAFMVGLIVALAVGRPGPVEPWGLVVAGLVFLLSIRAMRLRIPATAVGALAAAAGLAVMLISRGGTGLA